MSRLGRMLSIAVWVCVVLAQRGARGAEEVYLSDDAYFLIWVVDPVTGSATRALRAPDLVMGTALPRGRSGLAFDGAELFYTLSSIRRIYVLDPISGEVRRFIGKPAMGISGLGAARGSLFALAGSGRRGVIYRLDPASGEILGHIDLPGAREALDASASRGSLFARVGDFQLGEWSIDTATTLHSFTPPGGLTGLAFSEARSEILGVTGEAAIFRIDPERGAVNGRAQAMDFAGFEIFDAGGLAAGELAVRADNPVEAGGPFPAGDPAAAGALDLPATELDLEDAAFVAGEIAEVAVLLSSTGETQGFQTALVHEPAALRLEAVATIGTATAAHRADFTSAELFPNGGTLAVVFDLLPPYEGNALPPGQNLVVARYRYSCAQSDIQSPLSSQVRFIDGVLGSPPRDNLVVFEGRALNPDLFPGQVTCLPRPVTPGGPELFCGGPPDADGLPSVLTARSGDRAKLCFFYEFEQPQGLIQGVSMALAFDCRLTCLEETFEVPPESITALIGADFVDFQCESDPDDGDGCEMILGILADSQPPFGNASLPPTIGTPLLLACVQMEVGGGAEVGECLEVRFRDGVNGRGKVPIKNLVAVESGSIPPKTSPCAVCVTGTGPSFFCGGAALDEGGRPTVPVGQPGDEVDVCFWYGSPGEPVLALTQALRFDCQLECIGGSFRPAADLPELASAEFLGFQCENDPLDGDPCEMVLRIVARSETAANGAVLPPASLPRRLGCVTMRIAADAPRGGCLELMYQDGASGGETAFRHEATLFGGTVAPNTFDCKVCVLPAEPPKFLCGGPAPGPDGLPAPIKEVPRGERAELCFWYTSPVDELTRADEIQGLSMALCYDCSLKCVEDSFRVPADSILAEVEPEFLSFQCDNDPRDGDGCEMILGLLVDYLPPVEGRTLPPSNTPLKLACVDMEVSAGAKPGFCLDVKFCDGVNGRGKVPIKNLVSVNSSSAPPRRCDCAICVKHLGPCFFCGGSVLGRDRVPLPAEGKPGKPAEVCFWYCSPEDNATTHQQFDHIQGLSMALEYDCRLQCIESSIRLPPDSITAALGAEYVAFHCDGDPADGDGCEMVLAILIDAQPPFDGRTLPSTDVPLKVACVDVVIPEDARCGECFDLRFKDGVNGRGKVPIFNQVAVENMSFLAITKDCKVCVSDILDPVFQRGDCNFSGMGPMAVDIADAAELVSFLFARGAWKPHPPCFDACDANDDGRLDLADVFALLRYLFEFAPVPPAPGPDRPGPDPTPDKLGCDVNPCP